MNPTILTASLKFCTTKTLFKNRKRVENLKTLVNLAAETAKQQMHW